MQRPPHRRIGAGGRGETIPVTVTTTTTTMGESQMETDTKTLTYKVERMEEMRVSAGTFKYFAIVKYGESGEKL